MPAGQRNTSKIVLEEEGDERDRERGKKREEERPGERQRAHLEEQQIAARRAEVHRTAAAHGA